MWPHLCRRKSMRRGWQQTGKDCQKSLWNCWNCLKFTSRATELSHFNKFTLSTVSAERFKQSFVPSVMRLWIEHNGVLPDLFSTCLGFFFSLWAATWFSFVICTCSISAVNKSPNGGTHTDRDSCTHAPNQTPVFINALSLQLPSYHFHKIKSRRR